MMNYLKSGFPYRFLKVKFDFKYELYMYWLVRIQNLRVIRPVVIVHLLFKHTEQVKNTWKIIFHDFH